MRNLRSGEDEEESEELRGKERLSWNRREDEQQRYLVLMK